MLVLCDRHRLSKSGCDLNMWVCTSCSPPPSPPDLISPDKTLVCHLAEGSAHGKDRDGESCVAEAFCSLHETMANLIMEPGHSRSL